MGCGSSNTEKAGVPQELAPMDDIDAYRNIGIKTPQSPDHGWMVDSFYQHLVSECGK
jgi:hypothetical protein